MQKIKKNDTVYEYEKYHLSFYVDKKLNDKITSIAKKQKRKKSDLIRLILEKEFNL